MAKDKVAQAERRAMTAAYQKEITDRLGTLQELIKPKPKYCPLWLWQWGAKIFIDIDRIQGYTQGDI